MADLARHFAEAARREGERVALVTPQGAESFAGIDRRAAAFAARCAARGLGKILSGLIAMRLAGATDNVRRYLGFGLVPQAGVAVGLLLEVQDNPVLDEISAFILAMGVTAVAINEIVGPILVRIGLARSGDLGKDRARLIDFIHEENIVTGFRADSKEAAIRQLTDLLCESHGLQIDRERFVQGVLAREHAMSTCIGRGLAVPHGRLDTGDRLVGVMGVSREGLAFGTPDGLPVRCMVLMATPPDARRRHLEVQAALARSVGADWSLQLQLYNARTPAHVYEILHNEEFEDFNYFLDEASQERETRPAAAD